jgi:hypothetical protein
MILNAYTLFDSKSLVFNQPFFAHNHAVAIRMVGDIAQDANTSVGRHPSDYIVYKVGTYDDQTGFFSPLEIREHVIDVISLVQRQPMPDLFNTASDGAK